MSLFGHHDDQLPDTGTCGGPYGRFASDQVPEASARVDGDWHPSEAPANIRYVLIALGAFAVLGFTFLAGYLAGLGAR